MSASKTLSHTKWHCNYHVVLMPQDRFECNGPAPVRTGMAQPQGGQQY